MDNRRSRRHQITLLDCEQPVSERRQRPSAFAVGPLGRDIADQEAEDAGSARRENLLIEFRYEQEREQLKYERRDARHAGQDHVADFLSPAGCHYLFVSPADGEPVCFPAKVNGTG
ncbi:MAG: hypothetical protein ABIO43_05200 [Sphingomicrobium sp.]